MLSYLKLFALLQLRRLRVEDLAAATGTSRATLAKMRKGGNINTDVLLKICKYLCVQPGDIVEYIPDQAGEDQKQ